MKKIFTLIICLVTGIGFTAFAQLNMGTGVTWGELGASEPLLLNENFQGFEQFHSDETTDQGNSNNSYDTDGVTLIYGYKNDSVEVPILGSQSGKITYIFDQCAFAPTWIAAWAFKNATDNTPNVSNGFVEVSRDYGASGGYAPTIRGHFIVDLREIEFVEVIQWTHSSCGGNKRGVMCQFSLDDGATWDTLRYQPGNTWSLSFTKDPTTGIKTANGFRCDDSAYGMTWEDGIYASNVMLRFLEAGTQTPRIHDLKVYGTYTPPTSVTKMYNDDELRIYSAKKVIHISEESDVEVYSIHGAMLKQINQTRKVVMKDLPEGVYIVKAKNQTKRATTKILIK